MPTPTPVSNSYIQGVPDISHKEYVEILPRYLFLTNGVGVHKSKLRSFEMALRDALIANQNLVYVSSILPPATCIIPREKGAQMIKPGTIRHCVMARAETDEPHRLIAASIGLAKPRDKKLHGYISEHHALGWTQKKAADYAEELAAEMLASTLGIDFDPNTAWSEKEKAFKASKQIIYTRNITQTAIGNKEGLWTTVIASAVFIL